MAVISDIPGFGKLWKNIVGTPTREFNKGTNGTIDKIGNVFIGIASNFSPQLGKELADQWDSDMGYDRKESVMKALNVIKSNNARLVEDQKLLDQVQSAINDVNETSARATNRYQTAKALRERADKIRNKMVSDTAIGNAAQNALGDITEYSPITSQEIERRVSDVNKIIKQYEERNN